MDVQVNVRCAGAKYIVPARFVNDQPAMRQSGEQLLHELACKFDVRPATGFVTGKCLSYRRQGEDLFVHVGSVLVSLLSG